MDSFWLVNAGTDYCAFVITEIGPLYFAFIMVSAASLHMHEEIGEILRLLCMGFTLWCFYICIYFIPFSAGSHNFLFLRLLYASHHFILYLLLCKLHLFIVLIFCCKFHCILLVLVAVLVTVVLVLVAVGSATCRAVSCSQKQLLRASWKTRSMWVAFSGVHLLFIFFAWGWTFFCWRLKFSVVIILFISVSFVIMFKSIFVVTG